MQVFGLSTMPHDLSSLDPAPVYGGCGRCRRHKGGVRNAGEVVGDANRDVPSVDVQDDFEYVNLHIEVLRIQDEKTCDEGSELNEDEDSELNDTNNDMTNYVDLVDVNVALQEGIWHGKRSSHPLETREEPHVDVTSEERDWEAGDGGDQSDGFQSIDSGDEGRNESRLLEFR
ncbi:hypothetical protein CRG98_011796 [Punica granatum]|uniref:Uncharacterized protein n=1 Tax=Punica granatum TaxID=22663 RepID=A0A2I0KI14_PUNGR|nr:hypothetical protein CRG98_011796 [Punica granatum]